MTDVGRVVIAGAGLAGLSAADELRALGFTGELTIVGGEPHPPYDRPPLSKSILTGRVGPDTTLPQPRPIEADWRLGVTATRLDRTGRGLHLSTGERLAFDRLLIATGVHSVPWIREAEAALDGVVTVRTRADAEDLRRRLAAGPGHVLVVGAGFIGSEVASACCDLDLQVTVVEFAGQPLENALGASVGSAVAALQREHGVNLRLHTRVESIEGDAAGRVTRVRLSDGDTIDTGLVVAALGSRRNTGWLEGSGLVADDRAGVACDATMRAITTDGLVDGAIYAAGDIARWPHARFAAQMVIVEHWSVAVGQARHAARAMLHSARMDWLPQPYADLPRFWSNQFGVNIKSVGIPRFADTVVVAQGSLDNRRAVIVYGRDGHTVGAVALNAPRELEGYVSMVERLAPFPPTINAADWSAGPRPEPVPARFPAAGRSDHDPDAMVVGPAPADPLAAVGFPRDSAARRASTPEKEPA